MSGAAEAGTPRHSTARVPTAQGARYLQQLCRHWSHTLQASVTAAEGSVTFPRAGRGGSWPGEARLLLRAAPDALECRLEASAKGQLEALKTVVARHLDRFAFREAPLPFDWRDG